MKVLLVEDDAGIRDALQMMFEISGIDVEVHTDGFAIINDDLNIPDIFIIDKQLPGVDGLDVCRHIKANEQINNIPVIIISASPDTAKFALQAGADAFIEKPFKNKDVLQKVKELVEMKVPKA
jgi:DNA-binding response OmpR family regulator